LETVITFSPEGKEVTCAFKTASKTRVRSAVKGPLSPSLNLTQPIPKGNSVHTGVRIAGRSKLRHTGDVMGTCREPPKRAARGETNLWRSALIPWLGNCPSS